MASPHIPADHGGTTWLSLLEGNHGQPTETEDSTSNSFNDFSPAKTGKQICA